MEQSFLRMLEGHSQPIAVWKNEKIIFQNEASEMLFSLRGGQEALREIHERFFLDEIPSETAVCIDGQTYRVLLCQLGEMQLCRVQTDAVSGVSPFVLELIGSEVRNAAAVISMASRSVAELQTEENKQYLATMNHNYYKLARLGNSLQRFSQCESDEIKPTYSAFDLAGACKEIALASSQYLTGNNITVSYEGTEEALAWADRMLIEQAVLCLLSAAIKATGKNGTVKLEVSVTEEKIRITVRSQEESKGKTVPPSPVLEKYGLSSFVSNATGNIDAGLIFARTVAQKHEGALIIDHRPGIGTTAVLSIRTNLDKISNVKSDRSQYETSLRELMLTELADVLEASCYGRDHTESEGT